MSPTSNNPGTVDGRPNETLGRLVTIDALRGIAALMVLMYHARGMYWQGNRLTYQQFGLAPTFQSWMGYATTVFSPGFLGVTLFFVLSGYCVHRRGAFQLAKNARASLDVGEYAKKRLWRIYPVYVLALVLTAAVDAYLRSKVGVLEPTQDNSVGAFAVSLLTLQGFVARHFGSNGVFWTLAMEVHFYMLYPLLFLLSKRFGPRVPLLLTGALSIGYVLIDWQFGVTGMFVNRSSRGPLLLPYWLTWTLGFYLAEIEAKRAKPIMNTWAGLLLVGGVLGGAALGFAGRHEAAELFWAVAFTVLVGGCLRLSDRAIWASVPARLFAWVGEFSYSLYAIHAPVLLLTSALVMGANVKSLSTAPMFLAALWTIGVAWGFFRLVERWTLRPFWRTIPDQAIAHAAP